MGSLPLLLYQQHTAQSVKDHVTYSGAQRPARGGGARCPPTVRPPTPASRQAQACAAFPPARAMPATAVRQHRGPPGPPSCPRWPPSGLLPPASTGCAARTSRTATRQSQAQPQPLWGPGLDAGALRQYIASLARREERQERDRWRPSSPAHCGTRTPSWGGSPRRLGSAASRSRQERQSRFPVGAVASGRAPYGGSGAREISGTGRAQRRRCLSCAPPGGRIEEARRSVCSSALPSRRGARTSPGSPAVRGGSPAATLTGTQFRLLVREPVMAWTPRRHCLGGVSHGAAVDDGGVGFWPARPHDPAASTPCRLGRCLRRDLGSLGHRSGASHGCRPPHVAGGRQRQRGQPAAVVTRTRQGFLQQVVHTGWGKGCARTAELLPSVELGQGAC